MEEFKIVDTSKIQLQSLKNYMQELGYSYFGVDRVFYSPFETNKGRSTVSLKTAQLLHNGNLMDWHGKRFEDGCFDNIPEEWISAAKKAKIVHTVYLQRCKKGNYIKTQKHLVKFVNQENKDLLLK